MEYRDAVHPAETHPYAGALRGVVLGDAWGAGTEFMSIDTILRRCSAGDWPVPEELIVTDDTQMTLYLDRALRPGGNREDVQARIIDEFLAYRQRALTEPHRAPGSTVMSSLERLAEDPGRRWWETTNTVSDGSGTVMRTAPTAFLVDGDSWAGVTAFAAAVTHGTPNAIAASLVMNRLLVAVSKHPPKFGNDLSELAIDELGFTETGIRLLTAEEERSVTEWLAPLLGRLGKTARDFLAPGFDEVMERIGEALVAQPRVCREPWESRDADPSIAVGGGGWRGHDALAAAVLAIDSFTYDPWSALRRCVVTDGDSDTIAAVAGAFIGAAWPTLIASKWAEYRDRIEPTYRDWVESLDPPASNS